jgi:hypothetical protein
MPKWGLTPEQRRSKPWGLAENELSPKKTITDPIQGDIYVTRLEQRLLDSPPMQRLRRVRQLGTTHLVYPGATHTRFSHSLGALRAAQNLMDAVLDQRHGPAAAQDLFGEWESKHPRETFDKMVAEATVLARLGALLHDMCHVPFGHSVEDDLEVLTAHDENEKRFDFLWEQLDAELRELITPELREALRRPLVLSKVKGDLAEPSQRYPFVADIVGNTICADLLDYLPRDHAYTGLPASLGHRFINGFYVTPSTHPQQAQRMVIRISSGGRDRRDVVSEMFKYLRYRYELSERALFHHAKLAADAMIGKLLEMWRDVLWNERAAARSKHVKPYESDLARAKAAMSMREGSSMVAEEISQVVSEHLEQTFLRHGDDGLLEYVLASTASGAKEDRRRSAVRTICEDLLNRRLFKPIGYCSDRGIADTVYKLYGKFAARRALEEEVAKYAGLEHKWHVVLWIPHPDMKLKPAEVFVDDGTPGKVTMLKAWDAGAANRGEEIYHAHENLWGLSVFVHPSVKADPEKCDVVLARLAEMIGGVVWKTPRNRPQPGLDELTARAVSRKRKLGYEEMRSLVLLAGERLSARGSAQFRTFADLVAALDEAAEQKEREAAQLKLDISTKKDA